MNYKKTAALDKSICTNFEDFGKNADQLGINSWSQVESNDNKNLKILVKVFKIDHKGEFCKHKQINIGESDFK